MSDAERAALARLPDVVSVHRGSQLHKLEGWSWTLDIDRARWFALRGFVPPPVGVIVHGHVACTDVIGYLDDRGKSEVVCDPASVSILEIEVVRPESAAA